MLKLFKQIYTGFKPLEILDIETSLQEVTNQINSLKEQNQFIINQIKIINSAVRYHLLGNDDLSEVDQIQTRASFDYQWANFSQGVAMMDDKDFMDTIPQHVCQMTDLPPEWFSGKRIVDIGCGAGRYTYGLLSLGAQVTACDQSLSGLEQTRRLCKPFVERLTCKQINLLTWNEEDQFDMAFCFGVVHHTGNTYLAIRNVARKIKPGGKLFLMVYGFPERLEEYQEINNYDHLRSELRDLSFDERKSVITEKYGAHLGHGWFDAVSPRINDLLTFSEIWELLTRQGFQNIRRTIDHRNHHISAEKI